MWCRLVICYTVQVLSSRVDTLFQERFGWPLPVGDEHVCHNNNHVRSKVAISMHHTRRQLYINYILLHTCCCCFRWFVAGSCWTFISLFYMGLTLKMGWKVAQQSDFFQSQYRYLGFGCQLIIGSLLKCFLNALYELSTRKTQI